ncbi:MAG: chemotaxis protein [Tissierellia bacterium]|nr:chemotaxis protein [Tissierellia bacterium]
MENREVELILSHFVYLADYLPEFFHEDIIIGVTNTEKFIFQSINENIPVTVKAGDPVTEGDGMYEAMRYGRTYSVIIPKEKFGVTYRSTTVPIRDKNGTIIGAFGIGKSLEKEVKINSLAHDLSNSLQEISKVVNQISNDIQELVNSNTKILQAAQTTKEETEKTDEILNFVNNIAKKTNLLGLNASIEAARIGKQAGGFDVIANEIRQLSMTSNDFMKEIEVILKQVKELVK